MVKRGLDFSLSFVLLLLSLPLLAVAAILIRMTSPGPILFRQVRMGRGFRLFTIFKLRTMVHDRDGLPVTSSDDPRITGIGRLLRGMKVDELPQLWNVLRGEMSLVGPRPIVPLLVSKSHDAYVQLLQVRPGLTDPASLKYCREARLVGSLPNDPSCRAEFFDSVVVPDKARISAQYMSRATIWSDMMLILTTGLICCFPRLSRIYGELPDPEQWMIDRQRRIARSTVAMTQPRGQELQSLSLSQDAVDGCIFESGLVEVEAMKEKEERGTQSGALPWISIMAGESGIESAPQSGVERESRL